MLALPRRTRLGRRTAGRVTILALLLVLSAIAATGAWAREEVYWPYNYLTKNNPSAGTCPNSAAGVVCTGWNYWDESDADWNSGTGSFVVGFICSFDGQLWGRLLWGDETPKTYGAWWSSYCPTHYNRAAVAHVEPSYFGTYNYLRARVQIW